MCERETFSGYVLLIYNKVFFAGSSSVIGHPSPSDAARIVHDYNGLVCCKYKKRSITTPNKHTCFSRKNFPEPIKHRLESESFFCKSEKLWSEHGIFHFQTRKNS